MRQRLRIAWQGDGVSVTSRSGMSGVTRVARSRPNGSMSEEASKNPWCLGLALPCTASKRSRSWF